MTGQTEFGSITLFGQMNTIKTIGLIPGIPLLYFGLFFLGGTFTGAGHGSYFFGAVVLAPLNLFGSAWPLSLLMWPFISVLIALRRYPLCRTAAIVALGLHYVGVVMVCFQIGMSDIRRAWHSIPGFVLVFMLLYLASQAFMWFVLAQRGGAEQGAAPDP